MVRFVIRTLVVLLVAVLGISAARDLVCQVACAEPGAAHAAAACHESGEMAHTVLQSVQDHCPALDSSPGLTAIKVTGLQHQRAEPSAPGSTAPSLTLAHSARFELPPASCSSRALCPSVLRI